MAVELFFIFPPVLLAFLIYFSFNSSCGANGGKHLNVPPGSMGWPFLGQTISFMQPHSSSSLGHFMEQNIIKYGKIFRMNLLGKPTIVSADPELNRLILQGEGRLFEASCPTSIAEIMGKTSMLALVGDAHREMRSYALNFLTAARLRKFFLPEVEQQAIKIFDSWVDDSTFSAQKEGRKFAFNIMVKRLTGMDPELPETEILREEYDYFMKGMASLPLKLPWTSYRRALQAREMILDVIGHKLDERVKQIKEGREDPDDEDLLALVAKQTDITKEQILDLIISMLFGGHETTSVAVTLAMYFLYSCPEAIQQLREEHGQISKRKKEIGELGLNWEDYKNMKFTHCVINETLRLGNIVKFLHRRAIKDVQFKGYDIPCGWEVVPIISAAHLDPSIYSDPRTFNPWRWQAISPNVSKNNNVMSFSGGPRLCPGAELAKLEMAVFLHHLLQRFDWEVVEHDYPVSFPFLSFPKHLPIKVHHRKENN